MPFFDNLKICPRTGEVVLKWPPPAVPFLRAYQRERERKYEASLSLVERKRRQRLRRKK